MNRIVRRHYPVAKLPDDLRSEFSEEQQVTLIIETDTSPEIAAEVEKTDQSAASTNEADAGSQGGQFSRYKHLRRATYKSIDEINQYVAELRGEWTHRER